MELAPIIVFAYNRPHYLKETLTALSMNKEASESDLYIYCDGPKVNSNTKNAALINQVRELAYSRQWCKNVFIKVADVNKGLSQSVVNGVTEIVNKYGRIIVLEDDIVVSPSFLNYMNCALEKYKDEDQVGSISGYNFPIGNQIKNKETFFLTSFSSWGWATWKRAWLLYNHNAVSLLSTLKINNLEKEFNFNNTYRYTRILKSTIEGKADSWAIRWYATSFLQKKLTLFPVLSLVKNIGMVGTHIVGDNTDFLGSVNYNVTIKKFETDISENKDVRMIWEHHYRYYNRWKLNYRNIKYAISKIKLLCKI